MNNNAWVFLTRSFVVDVHNATLCFQSKGENRTEEPADGEPAAQLPKYSVQQRSGNCLSSFAHQSIYLCCLTVLLVDILVTSLIFILGANFNNFSVFLCAHCLVFRLTCVFLWNHVIQLLKLSLMQPSFKYFHLKHLLL